MDMRLSILVSEPKLSDSQHDEYLEMFFDGYKFIDFACVFDIKT